MTRRALLVGGGAGLGLLVGWAFWPRRYAPSLPLAEGDHGFGAWLAIRPDGSVLIGVPQSEAGQGVFTVLPQIVAGELGADWRTVAVQPVADNPLFANAQAAREWAPSILPQSVLGTRATGQIEGSAGIWATRELAERGRFIVTARSNAVGAFEADLRAAAAAARSQLTAAAAAQWGVTPEACRTEAGFVIHDKQRLAFAALAEAAAALDPADPAPLLADGEDRLAGTDVPRTDLPAKIDGSANFGGDIRLPVMLYAAIRRGPVGTIKVAATDRAAAARVPGFVELVTGPDWVAVLASDSFAARTAVGALTPRFTATAALPDDAMIADALDKALAGPGARFAEQGDLAGQRAAKSGTRVFEAVYAALPALHLPAEPRSATARLGEGQLELWMASDAPAAARAAAAAALGISEAAVTLYPMFAGGSFGAHLDSGMAADMARLARAAAAARPGAAVQMIRTRQDDIAATPPRPPVRARLVGTLDLAGRLSGFGARIAGPPSVRAAMRMLVAGDDQAVALAATAGMADPLMVEGAVPPYAIAHISVSHHSAALPLPTGIMRGGMNGVNGFFVESFIDELARAAGVEPLSFRMGMLSGRPRLARVLQRAAEMGRWDGGVSASGRGGSGRGIAAHSMAGGYIAVVAEARTGESGIRVRQLSVAVDVGRVIHPDIARQQIEGGLLFGLAQAVGAATGYDRGYPTVKRITDAALPLLADTPDIVIEFLPSDAPPGGYEEIGMVAVAPAIANALATLTGARLRQLPLLSEGL